jgi:D-arabinose 1-dehydrogenase-like Zn-dependent alcohol dehydrogenase
MYHIYTMVGASGGVGLMAISLATSAGMTVVGTASTAEGLAAVLRAGAVAAHDHSQPDYLNEVKASHPNGFDICVEMLANKNLGASNAILRYYLSSTRSNVYISHFPSAALSLCLFVCLSVCLSVYLSLVL